MKKLISLSLLILLLTIATAQAQNYSMEFGEISKEELELAEYPSDKEAEAVVLFDLGKSYFIRSPNFFDVVFERTTRVKILSDAGVKWAEVEIPFYQEGDIFEKVYDIEAYTYNLENGRLIKTPLELSNAFTEKINQYWNVKKFALPNVKKGSVIEYKYSVNSQNKFNFRDWEFQWKIPVVYSEYVAKMIPFYEYTFIFQGASKFDVYEAYEDKGFARQLGSAGPYSNNTYQDMVYKFGMKNVPAFRDEEFISSINDYIIKIDFQLSKFHHLNGTKTEIISTWEKLVKELLTHPDFGKYIGKSEKSATKIPEIAGLSQMPDVEKFDATLDYVKMNYNWNNSNAKFASKSPKQFMDDKFGNSADINLFTAGLLNGVGIESYPVIISTRSNGKIAYDYPFNHFFNYVIILAKIGNKFFLTDATEVMALNDRIPPRCINDRGLIIQKDKVEWIDLGVLHPSSISTYMQMELDEDAMYVDLIKSSTEYDALYYRNNYTEKTEDLKEKITNAFYSVIDSTIQVQNQIDKAMPYRLKYSVASKPELINDKIYIAPFLQESITDNPLKQKERKYPIDMVYPRQRIFNSVVKNPEGYQVDFLPKELKINNSLFELNYQAKEYNDRVQITFDYYFKQSIYQPADYARIKYYYNEIIKKANEKIVFIKKT